MKKLLCLLALCALAFVGCASARQDAQTAPFDYQAEDVLIDAGDHQIPATVTIPVGAKGQKFPAVVMLHGNGSNRHEAGNAYDYATVEMAKAGIASIRFDYLGNGDSKGDYIDYTYDQGIEDAMTCYNYIIRQAYAAGRCQVQGLQERADLGRRLWKQGSGRGVRNRQEERLLRGHL